MVLGAQQGEQQRGVRGLLDVETGRTSVVESLRDLGDQLAEMTDHVDQQGTAIDAATTARDRVRGAAYWLEARDGDQILDQVRRIGRQSSRSGDPRQ